VGVFERNIGLGTLGIISSRTKSPPSRGISKFESVPLVLVLGMIF